MPSLLALAICLVLVAYLLWRDVRLNSSVSPALWIPTAWFAILGSRFPSEWLSLSQIQTADTVLEGNPLNRDVFLGLIVAGLVVLVRRHVPWKLVVRQTPWVFLFFLFTAISIFWSDFPFTAFKRWHKVVGHVVMALVVWTDPEPSKAVSCLLRRCGYVLIPVSILFIKYFPDLGRGYSAWEFELIITGITTNKNLLGNSCWIIGLFFLSSLAMRFGRSPRNTDFWLDAVFLGLTTWTLMIADSATSLVCLLIGGSVIAATMVPVVSRHFSKLLCSGVVVLLILQFSLNLSEIVIESLGRDTTLTGRTELWDVLFAMAPNRWIGSGFESFWLGERLERLWATYWWQPNQAHNGYYETYLNLGLVGLSLQSFMMLSSYRNSRRRMLEADASGSAEFSEYVVSRFGLAFLLALALYNWTEATFKALHLSYFVFLLVATQYQPLRKAADDRTTTAVEPALAVVDRPAGFPRVAPGAWASSRAPGSPRTASARRTV
jgi:hypothetical protein